MQSETIKPVFVSLSDESPISRVVTVNPRSMHHKHTIIWIHQLEGLPEGHLNMFDSELFDDFKIIAPEAPNRFVTLRNQKVRSWFDIKFRGEKSFIVPFDEAFSTAEVIDNYERIIKPLIYGARQQLNKVNPKGGKLIIAGFSQGCGMSLHSFYSEKDKVDAVIGISGYLFPFTPFQKTDRYYSIIYGKTDNLRPWQYTKITYQGKIDMHKVFLVDDTRHEINQRVIKVFHQRIMELFGL